MDRKRSRNQYGIRAFIILLVVVVAGGIVLWTQNSLTVPLQMTNMILSISQEETGFSMAAPEDEAGFTMAPPEDSTVLDGEALSEREGGREKPVESSSLLAFNWDEISDVLYNLWVMLVATVGVIVVAKPAGWIVRQIKQPRQQSSAHGVTPNTMQ